MPAMFSTVFLPTAVCGSRAGSALADLGGVKADRLTCRPHDDGVVAGLGWPRAVELPSGSARQVSYKGWPSSAAGMRADGD